MNTAAPTDPGVRADLAAAWRTSWPVLLGYLPLGMAFGVLLTAAGLPWWWAFVWSVLIYGGSMQYLAVGLVSGGAGPVAVAVATFFVQFRHVFYGLTHPIGRIRSRAGRLYAVHALTDEAYAVLAPFRDQPTTGRFLVLSQVLCQSYWVAGATAGALLGSGLGLQVEGLGFAMTALFTILAIDTYRANPDRVTALSAALIATVCFLVFGTGMLVPALTVFVATLLVRHRRGRPVSSGPVPSGEGCA